MNLLLPSLRLLLTGLSLVCGVALALGLAIGQQVDAGRGAAAMALGVVAAGALALGLRRLALRRLSVLLARQEAEHQAEHLRFHTAIDNMSQGLCFFDGQQRLIVCNHRYAEMYRLTMDQVRPGTTLREIVDHRYASGCMPKMTREAYLAWRDSIAVADKPSNTPSTPPSNTTASNASHSPT